MEMFGYVTTENNEYLESAYVVVLKADGTEDNWGTITNNQGYFYFSNPVIDGNTRVLVSHEGYQSKIVFVKIGEPMIIRLAIDYQALPAVTVTPHKSNWAGYVAVALLVYFGYKMLK